MKGIPNEVDVNVLEEKVLNMFGKLGCDIPPERIEACRRIRKKFHSNCQIHKKERLSVSLECQEGPSKNKDRGC